MATTMPLSQNIPETGNGCGLAGHASIPQSVYQENINDKNDEPKSAYRHRQVKKGVPE
jgi:hypothetical protein